MANDAATPTLNAAGASPTIAQWFQLKSLHPDALLFLRMGDFYELFFHDAEAAAAALDIALTRRGEHQGAPIPMCGVPVHAADAYLARLIRRGFRVAVAEQMENPKARTGKGPLRREVVRLVTPGTLTEDSLLDAQRPNLLLALVPLGPGSDSVLGAAWVDVSTGVFQTEETNQAGLPALLGRMDPAEILAPAALALGDWSARRGPEVAIPSAPAARRRVAEAFGAADLDAFGTFGDAEATAAACILDYVRAAAAGQTPRLMRPEPAGTAGTMAMDAATRASLEITRARDGTAAHTLLSAIGRTLTAPGARLLAAWVSAPLLDPARIAARQDGWTWLLAQPVPLAGLRDALRGLPDLPRALGRMALEREAPRDLGAVLQALQAAAAADHALSGAPFGHALESVDTTLAEVLARALADPLPARMEDGGVIAPGFDSELDAHRALRDDSRRVIAGLTLDFAQRYGVASLKIRHHAQLGYVIEAPSAAVDALRARPDLVMRQAMTNGARFSNDELAALDRRITEAADAAAARERAVVQHLRVLVAAAQDGLAALASRLARLDVLQAAARLAEGGRWCRPTVDESDAFTVQAGRHPVVEAALGSATPFVPNPCDLSPARRVLLLTGPNMAGKSTFLRQNALIAILAQAGLPVPAERAHLGAVDRLFSRVGAADDLARGRSTFMVEMTETAAILNGAGPRSLVIVDEIGRGTGTLDGLAIAWAVLEALHAHLRCRTIFATHFHELTDVAAALPRVCPHTMRVKEWRGGVVFLHEVAEGAAGRSWGVHVAGLAGVPSATVRRAGVLLAALERQGHGTRGDLPLFGAVPEVAEHDPLRDALHTIEPDRLSPREALDAIYRLKALAIVSPPDPSVISP